MASACAISSSTSTRPHGMRSRSQSSADCRSGPKTSGVVASGSRDRQPPSAIRLFATWNGCARRAGEGEGLCRQRCGETVLVVQVVGHAPEEGQSSREDGAGEPDGRWDRQRSRRARRGAREDRDLSACPAGVVAMPGAQILELRDRHRSTWRGRAIASTAAACRYSWCSWRPATDAHPRRRLVELRTPLLEEPEATGRRREQGQLDLVMTVPDQREWWHRTSRRAP